MNKNAFSLVELSIVLVILGLLTGGILAGQSLIRAAELRSVTTEFQRFQAATMTFRDKYFALPGDIKNATAFWGAMASCPNTAGTGTQTCDGDGDGTVDVSSTANERFTFWQHLANAGLIEGNYTGVRDGADDDDATVGTNIPNSKLSSSGWYADYKGTVSASDGTLVDGSYGNALILGGQVSSAEPTAPIFSPEEAWNIDKKVDDGLPGAGSVVVQEADYACYLVGTANPSATTTTTLVGATFDLQETGKSCILYFRKAF